MDKICIKYNFSEGLAGMLVAFGMSIPEMTTNVLSCFDDNQEMIGFGFGTILGSGIFDFTICLGIASLFSLHYHKKELVFNINLLTRDFQVYIVTLAVLVIILWDYQVTLTEAIILTSMYPFYIVICATSPSK